MGCKTGPPNGIPKAPPRPKGPRKLAKMTLMPEEKTAIEGLGKLAETWPSGLELAAVHDEPDLLRVMKYDGKENVWREVAAIRGIQSADA